MMKYFRICRNLKLKNKLTSTECQLSTIWQAMNEKNQNAAKDCLFSSSDTSNASMTLECLKSNNQILSETTLIHIAAFEAYPGKFANQIEENGTDVNIDLDWTKMMIKRLNSKKLEAMSSDQKVVLQSVCPNLIYLNIIGNNDNVMVHFIDTTGEMAKIMNMPRP